MRELALFAGGGGGLYASLLLGHTPVCAVEIDPACRRMLLQRQADGVFPRFPIWDDVCTFDGRPWRGAVDLVSGGFPCQDISLAGSGAGLDGARSGLWLEMARIIREVRPRYAFVENSPALTARGLGRVLGDLAEMGFDARWGVLGAAHVGAPHRRERIWILAHSKEHGCGPWRAWRPDSGGARQSEQSFQAVADDRSQRREGAQWGGAHRAPRAEASQRCDSVADADADGVRQQQSQGCEQDERGWPGDGSQEIVGVGAWPPEPGIRRVVDGVADWQHRIRALGNGQVPRVAATAWRLLSGAWP